MAMISVLLSEQVSKNLHHIPRCNQSFFSGIVLCIGHSKACWQIGQIFEQTPATMMKNKTMIFNI